MLRNPGKKSNEQLSNANKESGLSFRVFSAFHAKGRFEGKNCRFSVAHKTWLKRCMTVIVGSL